MRARELAKSLDFTLIRPGVTADDLAGHCATAARLHAASVIVPPAMVGRAAELLRGGDVKVGTVISFPFGSDVPSVKAAAARRAVAAGAREVDVVVDVSALLSGRSRDARSELVRVVDAARSATSADVMVRAVVEAPLLGERLLRQACAAVAAAHADFAVTATGVAGAARPVDVEVMREALPTEVGVIGCGGVNDLEAAISLLDAGANRVATNAAPMMVQTLMGVMA